VAEGVETDAQLDLLSREGCTQVQGYLISKPRPIAEIKGRPSLPPRSAPSLAGGRFHPFFAVLPERARAPPVVDVFTRREPRDWRKARFPSIIIRSTPKDSRHDALIYGVMDPQI